MAKAKKETTTEAAPAPEVAPTQQQSPESMTLQDLVFVAQVFQLTSQRGTFKAEELEQVGAFYNKLIRFLQASGAIQKPEQKEEKQDA